MGLNVFATTLTVALTILCGSNVGRSETPAIQRSIVGTWRATSVSMFLEDGKHITLGENDGTVNLIVSDKTFTLRIGTKVLADMSYVNDPTRQPRTIDLKSKDGEMVGIYTVGINHLTISLNDKTKERPTNFDTEENGLVLTLNRVERTSLCTIDADGSNLKQILSLPDFTFFGSAKWSPDGSKIAFDTWRPVMGEGCSDAHIFVVNADGSSWKDLGPGAMPSWSPDGKKLACSQYGKEDSRGYGAWIMNADGTGREMVGANGWGVQWSPKSNEIAYTIYNNGPQLVVHDVAKKQQRTLSLEHSYSQIYWGLIWSPDGKWICFKGNLAGGGSEIAAVSAGGKKKLKVVLASTAKPQIANVDSMLGWGGPNNEILISTNFRTDRKPRVYLFDFAGGKPPKAFPGIPADWRSFGPTWSPVSKKLAFSAALPNLPAN